MVAEDVRSPQPAGSDMSLTGVQPQSYEGYDEPYMIPPYQQYRRFGYHYGRPVQPGVLNDNVGMPAPYMNASIPRTSTPVQTNGMGDRDVPSGIARPQAPTVRDEGTQAQAYPSLPRRPHKEPMRYNGKSDWTDYLGHFIAVAEWNQWSKHECGLQLACCLVDDAREVLGSLPHERQADFVSLTAALERRFSPPGRESRYSLELMNRTIRPGEDMAAYGHELRRLASRAYPDQALDERFLIDLFLKGLPNKDIKRHVHMAHPLSLAQAVDAAIAWEAFEEPEGSRVDRPRKPRDTPVAAIQPPKQTQTNAPNDVKREDESLKLTLEAMTRTLTGLEQRLQKMEEAALATKPGPSGIAKGRLADIECFFCHERGHLSRNCVKKAQAKQTERAQVRPAAGEPLNG